MELAEATHDSNEKMVYYLADKVMSMLTRSSTVGVLGVAYKPNTDVAEKAQGLLLAEVLSERKIPVVVYDPIALANAKVFLKTKARFARSMIECIRNSDVIVITTPWEEFKRIRPAHFAGSKRRRTIIDCWRILDRAKFDKVVRYVPLGVGLYE